MSNQSFGLAGASRDAVESEQPGIFVDHARAFALAGCVENTQSARREPSLSHRHDPNRAHQAPPRRKSHQRRLTVVQNEKR